MSREDFPLARSEGVIVEELDLELLVYDSESHLAHALQGDVAAVWRACDGRSDVRTLAARCGTSVEDVQVTLARLAELGLLQVADRDAPGDTRREALRKLALGGVGLAAVPTISSILVPTPAMAQSGTGSPALAISPYLFVEDNNYAYPFSPDNDTQVFTVKNTGTGTSGPLSVDSSEVPVNVSLTDDTCDGETLAPSETCTFTLSDPYCVPVGTIVVKVTDTEYNEFLRLLVTPC